MFQLLSVSADAKTVKGEAIGYLTGVLYFTPHLLSGYQVCAKATTGCIFGCLFTAGRGVYLKTQNARIRKTKLFFEDYPLFIRMLISDMHRLIRKAKRMGLTPVVRLNGTSDIPWEKYSIDIDGVYYRNIMAAFPDVVFYDYTKIYNRKAVKDIPNYSLTFSLADGNDKDAIKALENGMNVAVVIHAKRKETKPVKFSGYDAIDGDLNDVRTLDGANKIVLLRAKGKAAKDTSGFVKPWDYMIAA